MFSFQFIFRLRFEWSQLDNTMESGNFTHIYDRGNFNFNKYRTDLDLLEYEEIDFGQPSCNKSSFRVSRTTTVAEFTDPYHERIKLVVPYNNPRKATKSLLEGLRTTIENVNEQLQKVFGSNKLQINVNKFEVIEFSQIKTFRDDFELFFPVDVKTSLVTSMGTIIEVSINLDNPTSLLQTQEKGCQGSHFGFTIIGNDGKKVRGHILITNFVGFPSRNENFKLLPTGLPATKLLSFAKLCKVASKRQDLEFDITTEKGISDNQMPYQSERIKQLPSELQRIHNTFACKQFKLPSLKNISEVCDR